MSRFCKFLPIVVVAALFANASSAEATFALSFSGTLGGAPVGPTTVFDGGAGDLNPLVPNSIIANIGTISVSATGTTFLSTFFSLLDLAVSGSAAAGDIDLTIDLSVDGVTTAPPPQTLITMYTGSALGGTVLTTAQTWIDDANVLFGIPGTHTSGLVALGGSSTTSFSATPDYSATTRIRIVGTLASPTSLSLDSNNQITTPAPAGLLLALAGFPILGVGAWIRSRRNAPAKA